MPEPQVHPGIPAIQNYYSSWSEIQNDPAVQKFTSDPKSGYSMDTLKRVYWSDVINADPQVRSLFQSDKDVGGLMQKAFFAPEEARAAQQEAAGKELSELTEAPWYRFGEKAPGIIATRLGLQEPGKPSLTKGVTEAMGGMLSPENIAIIGATAGIGGVLGAGSKALVEAAPRTAKALLGMSKWGNRAVSAYFGGVGIKNAGEAFGSLGDIEAQRDELSKRAQQVEDAGDPTTAASIRTQASNLEGAYHQRIAEGVASGVFGVLPALHLWSSFKGKSLPGPVAGEAPEEAPPLMKGLAQPTVQVGEGVQPSTQLITEPYGKKLRPFTPELRQAELPFTGPGVEPGSRLVPPTQKALPAPTPTTTMVAGPAGIIPTREVPQGAIPQIQEALGRVPTLEVPPFATPGRGLDITGAESAPLLSAMAPPPPGQMGLRFPGMMPPQLEEGGPIVPPGPWGVFPRPPLREVEAPEFDPTIQGPTPVSKITPSTPVPEPGDPSVEGKLFPDIPQFQNLVSGIDSLRSRIKNYMRRGQESKAAELRDQLGSHLQQLQQTVRTFGEGATLDEARGVVDGVEKKLLPMMKIREFLAKNLQGANERETQLREMLSPPGNLLTPEHEALFEETFGRKPKVLDFDVNDPKGRKDAQRAWMLKRLEERQAGYATQRDLEEGLGTGPEAIAAQEGLGGIVSAETEMPKRMKPDYFRVLSPEDRADVHQLLGDKLTPKSRWRITDQPQDETIASQNQAAFQSDFKKVQSAAQEKMDAAPVSIQDAWPKILIDLKAGTKISEIAKRYKIPKDAQGDLANLAHTHLALEQMDALQKPVVVPETGEEIRPSVERQIWHSWDKPPTRLTTEMWQSMRGRGASYIPSADEQAAYYKELGARVQLGAKVVRQLKDSAGMKDSTLVDQLPTTREGWKDFHTDPRVGPYKGLPPSPESVANLISRITKNDPEAPHFMSIWPSWLRQGFLALPRAIQDRLTLNTSQGANVLGRAVDSQLRTAASKLGAGMEFDPEFQRTQSDFWGRTFLDSGLIKLRAKGLLERATEWAALHKDPYTNHTMNQVAAHELGHSVLQKILDKNPQWKDLISSDTFKRELQKDFPEATKDAISQPSYAENHPLGQSHELFANSLAHWYEGGGPKDGGIISRLIDSDPEISNAVGHLRDAAKDFKGPTTPLGKLSLTKLGESVFDKTAFAPSGIARQTKDYLKNLRENITLLPRDPKIIPLSDEDAAPRNAWINPTGTHAVDLNGNIHDAVARVMAYGKDAKSTLAHLNAGDQLLNEGYLRKAGVRGYQTGKLLPENISTMERDLLNDDAREHFNPRDYIYMEMPKAELDREGIPSRMTVQQWRDNDFKLSGAKRDINDFVANSPSTIGKQIKSFTDKIGLTGEESPLDLNKFKDLIRGRTSAADLKGAQFLNAARDLRNILSRLSNRETTDIIDDMEHGRAASSTNAQKLVDIWKKFNEEARAAVQSLGTGKLQHVLTNYFPHIWDDPKKAGDIYQAIMSGRRGMEGTKQFLRDREILYFKDGVTPIEEGGYGLTPKSYNPVDLMAMKLNEMYKYVAAHQILGDMLERKMAKWIPEGGVPRGLGGKPLEGWTKLNDSIFKRYEENEEGDNVSKRGSYWAPSDAASILNKHLSPGLDRYGTYRAVRAMGNLVNMAQLGMSGFHATMSAMTSMASDMALGTQQLGRGLGLVKNYGDPHAITKAVGNFLKAFTFQSPIRDIIKGQALREEVLGTGPSQFREDLTRAGGAVTQSPIYEAGAVRAFWESYANKNWAGMGLKTIPAVFEKTGNFIMKGLVPNLKLAAFSKMAEDIHARMGDAPQDEITRELSKAWDSVDNRFGQFRYDNLFMDRAVKDLLMVGVRSVGWDLGSIREIGGGATVDVAKALSDVTQGKRPDLTNRMAFIVGMTATAGYVGSLIHYLNTGKSPEKLEDYFFPQTGSVDAQGRAERISIPSYVKDSFNLLHDPTGTVVNKLHPLVQNLYELLSNKDFYNTEVRHKGDDIGEQLWQIAKFEGKMFVPIGVRVAIQQRENFGSPLAVSRSEFGIVPAPSYLGQSSAEQFAEEESRKMAAAGPRTSADVERAQLKAHLRTGLATGKLSTQDLYAQYKAGKLSSTELTNIVKESHEAILPREAKKLPIETVMELWQKASPEEKKTLRPIVLRRVSAAMKTKPEEEQEKLKDFGRKVYYEAQP